MWFCLCVLWFVVGEAYVWNVGGWCCVIVGLGVFVGGGGDVVG